MFGYTEVKKMLLPESQVRDILDQVVDGLVFLNENGIVHRDIKPDNIFATIVQTSDEVDLNALPSYVYKIGDFGLSKILGQEKHYRTMSLQTNFTICGSPMYTSPEIHSGFANGAFDDKIYAAAIDTFSLGVVLYRCLYGKVPFRTQYGEEATSNVVLAKIYRDAKAREADVEQ